MLKRQTRQRREFLYKKSIELKERQVWEKKQLIKDLISKGKPIPTELKNDLDQLRDSLGKDVGESEPLNHIDDEYDRAGIDDPKILITTSRNPSSKLLQFSKELRLVFPNAHRVNRGTYVMGEIATACRSNSITDLIIVHEHRGIPDAMVVSHFPHGPTVLFTLHNVVLRHDVPSGSTSTVSEQYPHLIFDGFSTKLGQRIMNVMKYLFPVPKEDSKRVMTFSNQTDFISFRHHVFVKTSHREVELAEVGPRFDLRPYEILQGTLEQKEADVEWVLRPYQRTARKRKQL
ncbi:anticodon-binding protein [Phakopsora pachyrhizi]|nr:anticodon-binding protein [Phakopsora pachyrhizi]